MAHSFFLTCFFGGLIEDFTKKVSSRDRLLLAFLSAAIACYELNLCLNRIDWLWFDTTVLSLPGISLFLTILMVGGVSHAANIIDGFNGLLLGFALMEFSVFSVVAWQLGDIELLSWLLIVIGSIVGLMLFNFPKGAIFTGDGGAYLIGFLLAVFALMLVSRHPSVSPWFPLLVLAYPVFETFFSIYRKKHLRGMSPGLPDGVHLHMLVYRRITPTVFSVKAHGWLRNALTSVVMWLFTLPSLTLALFWWDRQWVMILGIVLFCIYYVWVYFKIVRFKMIKNR